MFPYSSNWPRLSTCTAHCSQSHPGALLQPPSSYPSRWESSCRLWACRKLALGAGTGGNGAAVMSRKTDDNRQTDGTGARGRCASNAHPRPSFGARRQSGIQNGIPGERWSRVRGPQLRNLGAAEDLSARQFTPGEKTRDSCPGARRKAADLDQPRSLLFLTGEAASTQGREMAAVVPPKSTPFPMTVPTARWGDLTGSQGCPGGTGGTQRRKCREASNSVHSSGEMQGRPGVPGYGESGIPAPAA